MAYPLISIIIPIFNREQVIERTIRSCLSQTYENLEIIVIDDASVDNIAKVIDLFNDKRIKFLCHKINKGPAAARNTGLKNANGEFVAFLDSDDEWLPEKISRQIEVFRSTNDIIGLIFTNGYNEAEKRNFVTDNIPSGIFYNPKKDAFYPLRRLITPPSSWLLPMSVVRDTGYFDEAMYNWDDGDYLVRVAYKYPIYFLNENLVIWHASEKHVNVITFDLIKGKEIFLKKNIEFLKQDEEYLFRFYRAMGKDVLKFDKKKARVYLLNALKLKPFDLSTISKILRTWGN